MFFGFAKHAAGDWVKAEDYAELLEEFQRLQVSAAHGSQERLAQVAVTVYAGILERARSGGEHAEGAKYAVEAAHALIAALDADALQNR